MKKKIEEKFLDTIGTNLDRLVTIDYLDVRIHNFQIELMREIIQSPGRFLKLQPFFYGELILDSVSKS